MAPSVENHGMGKETYANKWSKLKKEPLENCQTKQHKQPKCQKKKEFIIRDSYQHHDSNLIQFSGKDNCISRDNLVGHELEGKRYFKPQKIGL